MLSSVPVLCDFGGNKATGIFVDKLDLECMSTLIATSPTNQQTDPSHQFHEAFAGHLRQHGG